MRRLEPSFMVVRDVSWEKAKGRVPEKRLPDKSNDTRVEERRLRAEGNVPLSERKESSSLTIFAPGEAELQVRWGHAAG